MTTRKNPLPLSVAEFHDLARSYIPEAVKTLRELAHSTDPSIAFEARRLLARATRHLHSTTPEHDDTDVNTIKGFQDATRR